MTHAIKNKPNLLNIFSNSSTQNFEFEFKFGKKIESTRVEIRSPTQNS